MVRMSNAETLVGEMVLAADDEAGLVVTYNMSATYNSYSVQGGVWEPLDCKTRYLEGERTHATANDLQEAKAFGQAWLAEMVNGTED